MSNNIDAEGRQHIDATRARAGAKKGVTRYILAISLTLVIVLFALIYFLT